MDSKADTGPTALDTAKLVLAGAIGYLDLSDQLAVRRSPSREVDAS